MDFGLGPILSKLKIIETAINNLKAFYVKPDATIVNGTLSLGKNTISSGSNNTTGYDNVYDYSGRGVIEFIGIYLSRNGSAPTAGKLRVRFVPSGVQPPGTTFTWEFELTAATQKAGGNVGGVYFKFGELFGNIFQTSTVRATSPVADYSFANVPFNGRLYIDVGYVGEASSSAKAMYTIVEAGS